MTKLPPGPTGDIRFSVRSALQKLQEPGTILILITIGALLIACSTPLLIMQELPAQWPLYVQAFPHITLYPVSFTWIVAFTLTCAALVGVSIGPKAAMQSRKAKVLWAAGVALLFGFALTAFEARGDKMMLFEVAYAQESSSTNIASNSAEAKLLHETGARLLTNGFGLDTNAINAGQRKIVNLTIYSKWKGVSKWETWARWGYLASFWLINAQGWFCLFLLGVIPSNNSNYSMKRSAEITFLWLILASAFGLICWLPFRAYYNFSVRSTLFGVSEASYNPLEWFVYAALFVLLVIVGLRLIKAGVNKSIVAVAEVVTLAIPVIGGIKPVELMEASFGLKSQPLYWFAWPLFLGTVVWLLFVNRELFLQIGEE